jgi:hypothetical protein
MAKVAKYHKCDCISGSCACPYRLDFRPQGVRGPRKRLEFPTKKAAESTYIAMVPRNPYKRYGCGRSGDPFGRSRKKWAKVGTEPSAIERRPCLALA